jgi:hypothetical protein
VTGLLAVLSFRFREALAGRTLWLLPLHVAVAVALVRSLPGPTIEARLQAADATALGLAAVLGLVAAAAMGASPLADDRLRPRGALLLASPVGAAARVLGTFLGTAAALLLLVGGLCASAMAAVDLGVGGAMKPPIEVLRPAELVGSESPEGSGIYWTDPKFGFVAVRFPRPMFPGDTLILRPRNGGVVSHSPAAPPVALEDGADLPKPWQQREPTNRHAWFVFADSEFSSTTPVSIVGSTSVVTGLATPLQTSAPKRASYVLISADLEYPRLGMRVDDIRLEGPSKPRALARALHAAALFGGLAAVMGAAMALSTVTGAGVAAGGALALAMLSLFQPLFADAADTLAHAGAMERTIQATLQPGQVAVALTGTPPALAPLFRAVAAVLPDGTRFDLSATIAANEVPWRGDALHALALGLGLAAAFLAVAAVAARRRP